MNRLDPTSTRGTRPHLVSFYGGGGGCGRSTLAAELAKLALRKGKRVLLVDADRSHPSQHVRFEVEGTDPSRALSEAFDLAWWQGGGDGERRRPDLLVVALRGDGRPAGAPPSAAELDRVLRQLDYELVIIDTASSLDDWTVDLAVRADMPLWIASTEPVSLAAATRSARAAVFGAMRALPEARGIESAIDDTREALPARWSLQDLRDAAERCGTADLLTEALDRFEPVLVLAQTRESAERELGQVIALAWWYLTGVRPRFAGAVDYDSRRWFHLRQGALTPVLGSESGSGVQFEELARRILEPADMEREQPRRRLPGMPPALHLLGMDPQAPAPEVRLMYRRLWEGVRRDHVGTQRLLFAALRERLVQDLETANRELQVWLSERPATTPLPAVTGRPRANPGALIREARTARNLTERELSLKTKIGLKMLKGIEEFDCKELPRATYLRQHLREIAVVLGIEPEPLLDTYLTAYADAQRDRILTRTTFTGG